MARVSPAMRRDAPTMAGIREGDDPVRIVVAHDLSIEAERAAELIARTPWPSGTTIRIVTSPSGLGTPLSSFTGPAAALERSDLTRELIETEHARIASDLRVGGALVETAVVPGRPGEAVVAEAARFEADLVVAGAGRQGPIAATVLGSVSAEIAERSPCSVLVVRAPRLERVVVATDGSPPATAAVAVVRAWPLFREAAITVVGVVDPSRDPLTADARGVIRDEPLGGPGLEPDPAASGFIGAAVAELEGTVRSVRAELRHGDPRTEVVAAAMDAGADLVVVGVNGEPLLRRLLMGSVARGILGRVTASVLIVRPPATPNAAGERPG